MLSPTRRAPTYALDIADGILAISRRIQAARRDLNTFEVFHLVASGETTWAEFANPIFAEAEGHGRSAVDVTPIATGDYPTPARRPGNSRLDTSKVREIYGVRLPDWRASLAPCVARLLAGR